MQTLKSARHLATAVMKHTVSEFRMPVPWGEMRGRIWGPDYGRPVLCIHGWSDNSGSFNKLIPLLPSDWRCLAIDLPGHGFSSPRPAGVFYSFPYYVADLKRVIEETWFDSISSSVKGSSSPGGTEEESGTEPVFSSPAHTISATFLQTKQILILFTALLFICNIFLRC